MDIDFPLILVILVFGSGLIWMLDAIFLAPGRRRALADLQGEYPQWQEEGSSQAAKYQAKAAETAREPVLVEYAKSFFPVLLVVFVLRSFLVEPFQIPSSSMVPTLEVGDYILVNKYTYGIRLPVINTKVINVGSPQRGDVMVFRFPSDPSIDYIKRVVGLPGDEVAYLNQKLSINGQPVETVAKGEHYDDDSMSYAPLFTERLGAVEHQIRVDTRRTAYYGPDPKRFPMAENCRYSPEGVTCKVPPGHYFMMGDNRDNSQDSRYWGFVPDENIVGKAFFVWMNFGNLGRIGPFH